eukprot:766442-Hanusia_phi.AAC.7
MPGGLQVRPTAPRGTGSGEGGPSAARPVGWRGVGWMLTKSLARRWSLYGPGSWSAPLHGFPRDVSWWISRQGGTCRKRVATILGINYPPDERVARPLPAPPPLPPTSLSIAQSLAAN